MWYSNLQRWLASSIPEISISTPTTALLSFPALGRQRTAPRHVLLLTGCLRKRDTCVPGCVMTHASKASLSGSLLAMVGKENPKPKPHTDSNLCRLPHPPSFLAAPLGVLREGAVVVQLYHLLVNSQNLFFSILSRLPEILLTCEVHCTPSSIMALSCQPGKCPRPHYSQGSTTICSLLGLPCPVSFSLPL